LIICKRIRLRVPGCGEEAVATGMSVGVMGVIVTRGSGMDEICVIALVWGATQEARGSSMDIRAKISFFTAMSPS
jgi:hypothetical protein